MGARILFLYAAGGKHFYEFISRSTDATVNNIFDSPTRDFHELRLLLPRRGYASKPRVAAPAATLGKQSATLQPRMRLRPSVVWPY